MTTKNATTQNTTPRPWQVLAGSDGSVSIEHTLSGNTIATLDADNADRHINIADAALIVQAVNEREALLAFVAGVRETLCDEDGEFKELNSCVDAVDVISGEITILEIKLAAASKGGAK